MLDIGPFFATFWYLIFIGPKKSDIYRSRKKRYLSAQKKPIFVSDKYQLKKKQCVELLSDFKTAKLRLIASRVGNRNIEISIYRRQFELPIYRKKIRIDVSMKKSDIDISTKISSIYRQLINLEKKYILNIYREIYCCFMYSWFKIMYNLVFGIVFFFMKTAEQTLFWK